MQISKFRILIAGILLMLITAGGSETLNATITGEVIDGNTGRPLVGVTIEIFDTTNRGSPAAVVRTDGNGTYSANVAGERNYDVWVRIGEVNPKQTVYVKADQVQPVNFEVSEQVGQKSLSITEDAGVRIVVIVAVLIIFLISIDQLFLRRRRMIKELESRQAELEKKMKYEGSIEGVPGGNKILELKKQRHMTEYEINLAKMKYHKREIDEESFREIVRDYSKKLIEIETEIKELEEEKKEK